MAAGRVALLVLLVLLNSLQAQGSEVFVRRGNDLRLDVKTPVKLTEVTDFLWKFGDSRVVRLTFDKRTTIFPTYKESVDFIEGNYSLLLKHVQHNNSGTYKAVESGENDKTVTEYKVTVQDEVSSVKVRVTPTSPSPSSCNLTVTCSTEKSNISRTVQCDNQTCSLVNETNVTPTIQTSSINVYLKEDYIVCNHSNQVSWKHDKKELKSHCEKKPDPLSSAANTIIIGVVPTIILALAVVVVCTVFYKKCKRKSNENTENGISQEVETSPDHVYQSPEEDAPDLHPSSTYALVQFPSKPGNSAETTHTPPSTNTPPPETVYAQVLRADKAK